MTEIGELAHIRRLRNLAYRARWPSFAVSDSDRNILLHLADDLEQQAMELEQGAKHKLLVESRHDVGSD